MYYKGRDIETMNKEELIEAMKAMYKMYEGRLRGMEGAISLMSMTGKPGIRNRVKADIRDSIS